MMTHSIFREVYQDTVQLKSKISQEVFDALDREAIADIVSSDDEVFWFEWYLYHDFVPKRITDWIVRHLEKKGYRYLYRKDGSQRRI